MNTRPAAAVSAGSLTPALAACQTALAAYAETPGSAEVRARLEEQRRTLARAVAALAQAPGQHAAALPAVMDFQRQLAASGAYDHAVSGDNLALAAGLAGEGAAGLLAATLLTPAWQWPEAPALAEVPEGLWSLWTAWLFYAPQGFCEVGQADAYAAHCLRRLEEFDRLVAARPAAKPVRAALAAYASVNNSIPLYFTGGPLRRHMELRGRLLQAWGALDRLDHFPVPPRAGRRLRVGFINRHFGSQTETYTTLPTFERLDPARFEVLLFAHRDQGTPLEKYAQGCAAGFTLLPEDPAEQLRVLRAAGLDVAVFGTNVTAVCHEVTRLALHRVAPLQVVNNSSCTTTGLPAIDLYVSGTATEHAGAPAHFTERLGLVQGPAHAFNYEADRQEPAGAWSRAALGLPEDALVFVSAANFFKVTPEMQHAWANLLAAVPGSRLLLHPFNPNWSSRYPIRRFCAEFDRVLAAHGVAGDRLVVSSVRFPSRTDVRELLRVGDLYLDTFPFAGVNSLIDPLETGVPVVTREGETFRSRMGAALLRQLGLGELAVTGEAAYHDLAVRLATDAPLRAEFRARILAAMERLPLFLDTLAASEAFGTLLEQAWDELAARGRTAFRGDPAPLVAPEVAAPATRHARGRELLAAGNAVRAADHLLAAIQHDEQNAALWRDLADALRRTGRVQEAVQSLETCLRLDPRNPESWRLLADLAATLGHAQLQAEATAMLGQLTAAAPARAAGPRVLVYTDDPDAGGVAQYNHSLLVGLTAAGCTVDCAQSRSESPLLAAQRELGVVHHWIPYDTKKEFARTIEDAASARRILEAAKPDLIIFSDCCPVSNMAARDAAHQLGVPYVVVVGFVGAYLADRFKAVLGHLAGQYARARAVVAVSQENLDLLRTRFGLPATAGQVIHYGRPERFFAPRDEAVRARLRAELGLPADAVVSFTAARLAAVKGFLYQVLAAKHLAALPGAEKLHFVWAGDGDQRPALEQAIASAGLTDRVHLLGHRWDVADWYDAADIFVLPSDMEGMPLAIMEAMAKGLPVIATAVSGIPEELGDTGQLLPSAAQNRAALVSQLIRTLHLWTTDAALRRAIGEAGRARAQAMFRESLMIERTVALIGAQLSVPATAAASA